MRGVDSFLTEVSKHGVLCSGKGRGVVGFSVEEWILMCKGKALTFH